MEELERLRIILQNDLASVSEYQRFKLRKHIKQLESMQAVCKVRDKQQGEKLAEYVKKELDIE